MVCPSDIIVFLKVAYPIKIVCPHVILYKSTSLRHFEMPTWSICNQNPLERSCRGYNSMRNITAPHNTSQASKWSSPVPYLLGGVGFMVALVAFALIFLAWSYLKSQGNNVRSGQSNDSSNGSGEKNESLENIMSSSSHDK